jgi:uncharacterized membrane protein
MVRLPRALLPFAAPARDPACVPYLIEALLFLLPFAAYGLWRRANPSTEPSTVLLVLAACGVVLMLGGAIWYGLSRSMEHSRDYVPVQLERSDIPPSEAHPRR